MSQPIKHHPMIEEILGAFSKASPIQADAANALRGYVDYLVKTIQAYSVKLSEASDLMNEAARRLEEFSGDSAEATPEVERATADVLARIKSGAKS